MFSLHGVLLWRVRSLAGWLWLEHKNDGLAEGISAVLHVIASREEVYLQSKYNTTCCRQRKQARNTALVTVLVELQNVRTLHALTKVELLIYFSDNRAFTIAGVTVPVLAVWVICCCICRMQT